MPINYVTHPGVSITAACFGNGMYSANSASRCISNLLAAQYRRFVLDVYWDANAGTFGFCPVQLPGSAQATTTIFPAAPFAQMSSVQSSRSSELDEQDRRQVSPSASASSANGYTNATSTTTSTRVPTATVISSSGETLFSLGSYQCSQGLNLADLPSLILGYLQSTADTIHARVLFLEFNLHAAATADAPNAPANTPPDEALPSGSQLVAQEMNSTLHDYIYTPIELASDRSDLNSSWYHVPSTQIPVPEYYGIQRTENGDLTTLDGWPTEAYVQTTRLDRMLMVWGSIDPQMQNYSFAADSGVIFPQGYLADERPFSANDVGELTSGCFFDAEIPSVLLENSSWALSGIDRTIGPALLALSNNLTSCGLSPMLNETLSDTPASDNLAPYLDFTRAAIWNWAPGEPRNNTVGGFDDDNPPSQFRCALMDTSSAYRGHWRVEDCPNKYHAACRVNSRPYEWLLSDDEVSFNDAPYACSDNAVFSTPRTGLENQYLYRQALSQGIQSDPSDEDAIGVWVNFNSLDIQTCWVATGPNGSCPYYVDAKDKETREILVPTIAAIIVFVLTALTIFVKCNVNRRNSRARSRGDGNWDYEGVPS